MPSKKKKEAWGRVRRGLLFVLEATEPLLDGVPIPGVKGTVSTLRKIVELIELSDANEEMLETLTTRIKNLQDNVVVPSKTISSEGIKTLEENVKKLNEDLDEYLQRLIGRPKKRWYSKIYNTSKDAEDMKGIGSKIDTLLAEFVTAAAVRIEAIVLRAEAAAAAAAVASEQRMQQQLAAITKAEEVAVAAAAAAEKRRQEELVVEDDRLVGKLPYSHYASYDYPRKNGPGLCFEGTRENLLRELKEWAHGEDSPRIFWVNGRAGAGKSTITHTFATWLHKEHLLGASFVFQRSGNDTLRNAVAVFPTLAYHLAQLDPKIKSNIAAALRDDPQAHSRTYDVQFEKLILNPLRKLDDDPSRNIVVLLDALDECQPEDDAAALISLFFKHQYCFPFNLRVFFTSRPEHHIRNTLTRTPIDASTCTDHNHDLPEETAESIPRPHISTKAGPRIFSLHSDISQGEHNADIEGYLRAKLTHVWNDLDDDALDQWPPEEDLRKLALQSGDLFVYAATVVRFIGHKQIRNPQGQLKILLDSNQVAPGAAFVDLDNLYLQIIKNALPDDSSEDHIESFQKVVGAIIYLRKSFSITDLSAFLGDLGEKRIRNILYHLHSVMVVPDTDSEAGLRAYHLSFTNFITDSNRCPLEKGYISLKDHNLRLFRLCVTSALNSKVDRVSGYGRMLWAHHLTDLICGNSTPPRHEFYELQPGIPAFACMIHNLRSFWEANHEGHHVGAFILPPEHQSSPFKRFWHFIILYLSPSPTLSAHIHNAAQIVMAMKENDFFLGVVRQFTFDVWCIFLHQTELKYESLGGQTDALGAYDVLLDHTLRLTPIITPMPDLYNKSNGNVKLAADNDPPNYYEEKLTQMAFTCAIRNQRLDKAIEYVEVGQVIIWRNALCLPTSFYEITAHYPEVGTSLESISTRMSIVWSHLLYYLEFLLLPRFEEEEIAPETIVTCLNKVESQLQADIHFTPGRNKAKNDYHGSNLIARALTLNNDYDQAINKIRQLEGFQDFLRPRQLSSLEAAAREYPVVILIPDDDVSHVFIMTSDAHIPIHFQVPRLAKETLVQKITHPIRSLWNVPVGSSKYDYRRILSVKFVRADLNNDLAAVLRLLWTTVVKDIIERLRISKGHRVRVQWCPTGLFTLFPIHAAGIYDAENRPLECASDYIISSYTPTIGMLLNRNVSPVSDEFKMMVVVDEELPGAMVELEKIQHWVENDRLVKLGPGFEYETSKKVDKIMEHIPTATIVHFACHGDRTRESLTNSSFFVGNGESFGLSELRKISKIPSGSLAFLSVCDTGFDPPEKQKLNTGASLLVAGYRNVVGTMWRIRDSHGPIVADAFYKELFLGPDGKVMSRPNMDKCAEALDSAVRALRSSGAELVDWVPFVHFGA